ncbi:hypothetical protein AV530_016333 [Patagioenas fasciata monilis]|uniref:Uncharacterized protein n=1 Tax=Patagioenas fasciata monilis TaxID=372326 RepID=A0A1V4KWE3_PATFA|nr:hypothetical protein AV530_016333 [Patagioenas fasciata monilis]
MDDVRSSVLASPSVLRQHEATGLSRRWSHWEPPPPPGRFLLQTREPQQWNQGDLQLPRPPASTSTFYSG